MFKGLSYEIGDEKSSWQIKSSVMVLATQVHVVLPYVRCGEKSFSGMMPYRWHLMTVAEIPVVIWALTTVVCLVGTPAWTHACSCHCESCRWGMCVGVFVEGVFRSWHTLCTKLNHVSTSYRPQFFWLTDQCELIMGEHEGLQSFCGQIWVETWWWNRFHLWKRASISRHPPVVGKTQQSVMNPKYFIAVQKCVLWYLS